MVQTRAKGGAEEQQADSARAARLTRRRGTSEDRDGDAARDPVLSAKAKGKQVSHASNLQEIDEDDEENEAENNEEGPKDGDEVAEQRSRVESYPVARFGAPRGSTVKDISPPPMSESEMGSQSATQRYEYASHQAAYTRFSSVIPSVKNVEDPLQNSREVVEEVVVHGAQGSGGSGGGGDDDGDDDDLEAREKAEFMEAALEPYWSATESLAKMLSDVNTGKNSWKLMHQLQCRNWRSVQELFMDEGEVFIDLPQKLAALSEKFHCRGRVVIAAANATALKNELFEIVHRDKKPLDLLERLDEDFPAPFLIFIPEDPTEIITDELVELALDIRTQRLIAGLAVTDVDTQNPTDLAAALFCDVGQKLAQRARAVKKLVKDRNVLEARAVLDMRYPFDADDVPNLVGRLGKYASEIISQAQVFFRGPPPSVREPSFVREPSSVRASSPTDSLASSITDRQIVRKDVYDNILTKSNAQHLAHLISQGDPPPRPRSPSVARSEIIVYGDDVDAADASPRPPSPANSDSSFFLSVLPRVKNVLDRQSAEAQPTISGAAAASHPATQQSSLRRVSFTPVNSTKRPLSPSQESDDPFEEDSRQADAQRREQLRIDRLIMPPPPRSRPLKRQRRSLPSQPIPSSSQSSAPPPSGNPSGSLANSTPPNGGGTSSPSSTPSSSINFGQLREQNRIIPARSNGVQQRVPWSDRDTERLVRLIEHHKCFWSKIARRQDPDRRLGSPGPEDTEDCVFDHPRDQQAIRDKARNLKVDLLKGDHPLYPFFDYIALGKKEREALISRGKNPDRKESDVDINGEVINTVYLAPDLGEDAA
ncbi:hypothetical protein C8034_v009201 [Colletotrichum sidae]|uniref:Myb-like domain-containing protein n=1 Tax=Colletotrichum sidae TaxID=1347389 RepID=A0A4V3I3V7_9PEZI|nr:hypothetical protein C8034_v009201 [Colletotrichum sidae]